MKQNKSLNAERHIKGEELKIRKWWQSHTRREQYEIIKEVYNLQEVGLWLRAYDKEK